MNPLCKLVLAAVPLMGLAACGGGDTEDRLDVADPTVRFVHASAIAPNLTLFRANVAQSDATNVAYRFASNYFDVGIGISDWPVKTAVGGATVGTVSIDPVRGNKYTVVALATSGTSSGAYLIRDPYNKALTSDSTRLRVMNASFNASNIDLYINPVGTDISRLSVAPQIPATAFNTAGPASGRDSIDVPGGTYQLTITTAGTKSVLFRSQLSFGANKDILLLTVPDPVVPTAIKTLMKIEGTAGTTDLPPS